MGKPSGPESGVTSFGELVFFETPTAKNTEQKSKQNDGVKATFGGSTIVCRKCGESGHWTMKCPHPDSALQNLGIPLPEIPQYSETEDSPEESNKYIPPSRRTRTEGDEGNDEFTQKTNIRISNLDETATNDDLRDLFERFGHVKSARVITDRNTNMSRGFGYVDFGDEESAQSAMDRLQGYAYGHQILSLSWAKPKRRF